jgi:hypothetical protein
MAVGSRSIMVRWLLSGTPRTTTNKLSMAFFSRHPGWNGRSEWWGYDEAITGQKRCVLQPNHPILILIKTHKDLKCMDRCVWLSNPSIGSLHFQPLLPSCRAPKTLRPPTTRTPPVAPDRTARRPPAPSAHPPIPELRAVSDCWHLSEPGESTKIVVAVSVAMWGPGWIAKLVNKSPSNYSYKYHKQ